MHGDTKKNIIEGYMYPGDTPSGVTPVEVYGVCVVSDKGTAIPVTVVPSKEFVSMPTEDYEDLQNRLSHIPEGIQEIHIFINDNQKDFPADQYRNQGLHYLEGQSNGGTLPVIGPWVKSASYSM